MKKKVIFIPHNYRNYRIVSIALDKQEDPTIDFSHLRNSSTAYWIEKAVMFCGITLWWITATVNTHGKFKGAHQELRSLTGSDMITPYRF